MSTKAFTAATFAWLRLLKTDHDLTALAVGVQLTEHFNEREEGGVAYPGSDFIAAQLGMSQSTVVRALHRMHDRRRIRVAWGKPGRGFSNRIWMTLKHAPEHVSEGRKHAPDENKTCAGAYEPLSNHYLRASEEEALRLEGERDARRRASPAADCGRGAKAPAAAAKKQAPAQPAKPAKPAKPAQQAQQAQPAQPAIIPTRVPSLAQERSWRELRALWERGHWIENQRADRRAFDAACREVAPEGILAAAAAWVKAADAPRFLPPLWRWLDGDGWQKKPPERGRHGQTRQARGLPRTNGNKVNCAALAFNMFDDDGNYVLGAGR